MIDRLSDAELAPRLEALYHLAWAETYLEFYDDAIAHAERGVAIARAFGEGRLLVPLMLAKNFPFEMQGRLREAIELCETALEAARLSASPHELYRALFELGWTLYYAGDLDGAIAAYEESSRVDPRLAGATIPNGGGGPGWGLGVAWFEAGEIDRGRTLLLDLVGDDGASTMPVERCFDWESLTLVSLAVGDTEAANRYAGLAEEDAARLRAAATDRDRRTSPGGCASRGRRPFRRRPRGARVRSCGRRGRSADCRPPSLAASRVVRSRPPASVSRRSRCCARRSKSSMRVVPCACGMRCAASCGDSEPGRSRAGRRPATAGSTR